MKQQEALELMRKGQKMGVKAYGPTIFYQHFQNDRVIMFNQNTSCAAIPVSIFKIEEFLQTGNIDFVPYDEVSV